ncbi:MAG: hypothetical protein GWO20_14130 [Candidatus Korarchaeota archaeon]|nr:hypothetical protein [Candidatus Korarchaeota archaeon]NIU84548.1 hypothetical protein [Candidatus Thorarchaeota archaeon]NIW14615.1 hypothetical protein [Candidatus Thorarchaeota archaeon]NIW52687.1 hypothetical protein [Candidatus Korarchaeota archaeon]
MSRVKELFEKEKPAIGTWVTIQNCDVVEALSTLPFDWFVFDWEHSPADISTLQTLLPGIRGTNITPFVRVPWNAMVRIKRVLDIGLEGILVPYVNSKEEAKNAVKACRYPPNGVRGVGPRRATMYGSRDIVDYFHEFEEEDLIVGVLVETQKALNNLDEILAVEGIELAFVGPYDLSANLKIFGQFEHPKFKNAIQRVLNVCEEVSVTPGIYTRSAKKAKVWIENGFRFVSISSDYLVLRKAYSNALKGLRDSLDEK